MPSCAEANTDTVDVPFDALVCQHLTAIDQEFGLLVDLHSMVGQSFHDTGDLRAIRLVALARVSASVREVYARRDFRLAYSRSL